MTHEDYFNEAGEVAKLALCLRDKCGAVIVNNGEIVGRGYNAPPNDEIGDRKCHLELAVSPKPKSDRTCCVHAEWRAIIESVANGKAKGSILYFVRINDEGELKKSDGIPYCTVCSRLALDNGITSFGLWTNDGAKMFSVREYNELSYAFHMQK